MRFMWIAYAEPKVSEPLHLPVSPCTVEIPIVEARVDERARMSRAWKRQLAEVDTDARSMAPFLRAIQGWEQLAEGDPDQGLRRRTEERWTSCTGGVKLYFGVL